MWGQFNFNNITINKIRNLYKENMYNFFKKKPLVTDTAKNQSNSYYAIKDKLELPLKIKLFM